MFNSLRAQSGYNDILLFVMHILVALGISFCIFHVPSAYNLTADALSPNLPGAALSSLSGLHIHLFQPPCKVLGLHR